MKQKIVFKKDGDTFFHLFGITEKRSDEIFEVIGKLVAKYFNGEDNYDLIQMFNDIFNSDLLKTEQEYYYVLFQFGRMYEEGDRKLKSRMILNQIVPSLIDLHKTDCGNAGCPIHGKLHNKSKIFN